MALYYTHMATLASKG